MSIWVIFLLVIIGILLVIAIIRAVWELYHLQTVVYDIASDKIAPEDRMKVVFLSDLHGRKYGHNNEKLIQEIASVQPDAVLLGGDMLTASSRTDFHETVNLLRAFAAIAPVYYAPGNHEKRLSLPDGKMHDAFCAYRKMLTEIPVSYLENSGVFLNHSIYLYGLDIPETSYGKFKQPVYSQEQFEKDISGADAACFRIVMAHSPGFFEQYASTGADLFLAGHYHGGAVRIGKHIGLISPQFVPLPKYSRGLYEKADTSMIVSAGCGSHKVNLRLHNRPEIVVINIHEHSI